MISHQEFINSLKSEIPPTNQVGPYLLALWYAYRGDWHQAHGLVEELKDQKAAHVHAYLHRVEGDDWNAGYWYRKAGVPMPVDEEWTRQTNAIGIKVALDSIF